MDIKSNLAIIARKLEEQRSIIQTEEGTKNAFIMPFIQSVLGYDVFNPKEVNPEFIADVGLKKGEKVDYAILKDGEIQILIECKKLGQPLDVNHASQLFRYFHCTTARIGILTNGQVYQFYTDLDQPNKMDKKPFLSLDLLNIDDHALPELAKLTKPAFDVDSIINAAGELKYVSQIKGILSEQLTGPDDEFVRFFATRVYDKIVTQRVREQFSVLVQKAFQQFINDKANDRLKSAMDGGVRHSLLQPIKAEEAPAVDAIEDRIDTTFEELEGFNIVRAIVRSEVDVKRVTARDTQSYFGILLDDNNRKPICRLHFNRSQKYLGLLDAERKETRHPIDSVDDIFKFSDALKEAAMAYQTAPNEA